LTTARLFSCLWDRSERARCRLPRPQLASQASVALPETGNPPSALLAPCLVSLPAAPLLVCGFYVLVRSDRRNMRDTDADCGFERAHESLPYGREQGWTWTIEPPIIGASRAAASARRGIASQFPMLCLPRRAQRIAAETTRDALWAGQSPTGSTCKMNLFFTALKEYHLFTCSDSDLTTCPL
jgi:hypothetical protein